MSKNNSQKKNGRQSASTRRGIEARKITAPIKETVSQTLRAVRAGNYA